MMKLFRRSGPVGPGVLIAAALIVSAVAALAETSRTPAEDAAAIVAALDTEYQSAVKRNDAAAMDRILADDFILVSSSGKVHDKAELLREARSGETVYEHQEDSEQTVRMWGDTAVV